MYRNGAALAAELMWTGWATYGSAGIQGWLQSPRPPDLAGMGAAGGGAAFALLLAVLRNRFTGFPFHPMGYALGMGTTVDRWWFACRERGIAYHRITTDTPFGLALRAALVRPGGIT